VARLLLVDANPNVILKQVHRVFDAAGHEIDAARTGEDGVRQAATRTPDAILLDLRLPDLSGLEVYRRLRQIDARIPVIFITATSDADSAIEAMKQGAYDYLFKPLDLHQLRRVVGEALEVARRMREPAVVAETSPDPDVDGAIVGRCPAMVEVYNAIGRVAGQAALHRGSARSSMRGVGSSPGSCPADSANASP
jgi:DNA-binding NtrC family response regulator